MPGPEPPAGWPLGSVLPSAPPFGPLARCDEPGAVAAAKVPPGPLAAETVPAATVQKIDQSGSTGAKAAQVHGERNVTSIG